MSLGGKKKKKSHLQDLSSTHFNTVSDTGNFPTVGFYLTVNLPTAIGIVNRILKSQYHLKNKLKSKPNPKV